MSLADLLNYPFSDRRTRIGLAALRLLARTGRLYFSTRSTWVENRHFRREVFQEVLAGAATVACQNGCSIDVRNMRGESCALPASTPERDDVEAHFS
jgi:23S rRNA G2069 N7-methylase RlmK/C1962 C5-methylase RlmI